MGRTTYITLHFKIDSYKLVYVTVESLQTSKVFYYCSCKKYMIFNIKFRMNHIQVI